VANEDVCVGNGEEELADRRMVWVMKKFVLEIVRRPWLIR